MEILSQVKRPEDLKKLNKDELKVLAQEIRDFLIEKVSKTGGHLSSNLGAVELTIALHRVFDAEKDKIVWDVGHQSYVHKILTGRKDAFDRLRQDGGLSGFPKRDESRADSFNTGHSSTSISAALGFAEANRLSGGDSYAVAVIGDGALTGGMAFEAMNQAGASKTPLIIILNDNGISISKNVGGLSKKLTQIRSNAGYYNFKDRIKGILRHTPFIGKWLELQIIDFKKGIKNIIFKNEVFENLGIEYMGPIDGHNIEDMEFIMNRAKKRGKPVCIHIHTVKGKGYKFAEENPSKFHGIGKFNPENGEYLCKTEETYSSVFGNKLVEIAEKNDKVVGITAAMPEGTGLMKFRKQFRDRFYDVGIAEQHAVTFATGLALSGYTPVFAVYSTFLQRAYDQILHDTALQNAHVVFAIDRAGAVGNDGETHQGIYDLSYLSHIPNMTVLAPKDADELEAMLDYAVNVCTGPVAIRYPRGEAKRQGEKKEIKDSAPQILTEGEDLVLIGVGTMTETAEEVAKMLKEDGVNAEVVNPRFVKPVNKDFYEKYRDKKIFVLEENTEIGGFADTIRRITGGEVYDFAYKDEAVLQGTINEIKERYGLNAKSVYKTIKELVK
ncbi:MAG: 1-deoxy-D-xylulose-5-phosphate synthase [Clostridia bacterium]|nr:1-deoxy-D-xylulose-5-phosphate synthase [Clostridia bacterium]